MGYASPTVGPTSFGYAGVGDFDPMTGLKRFDIQQQDDTANADNSTWATLSFLVGAAAATGVWYFFLRPKGRR